MVSLVSSTLVASYYAFLAAAGFLLAVDALASVLAIRLAGVAAAALDAAGAASEEADEVAADTFDAA